MDILSRSSNPQPDLFWFEDKTEPKNSLTFSVQWLFEQNIYALRNAASPVRFRVLAILTPKRIGKDELIRSYAIGYDGGTITGPSPGISSDLRITSDYTVFDYPPKDGVNKLVTPANNLDAAQLVKFPGVNSPYNNYPAFWAHDISHSEVYANSRDKHQLYRVLQILIPAFVLLPNNKWPVSFPLPSLSIGYPVEGGVSPTALLKSGIIDDGFLQYP